MKHDRRQENPNSQELFSIGVTMEDIYSEPDDNFVYGCASMQDGVGIYSFARLDPLFPDVPENQPCREEEKVLVLKRAISIFIHEVTHLFGLEHCIYYLCLMNGTEHEKEMDKQPLYLCPICLRKLYSLFRREKKNFNVKDMYIGILDLCRKFHFQEDAQWHENRLKLIFNNENF
jgi:archaemetzincin